MFYRKRKNHAVAYGPYALVTGASSGLGYAIAHALAAEGLGLVLVARDATRLAALANELNMRFGTKTLCISQDFSAPGSVGEILSQTSHLDIGLLVAAAGFGTAGPFSSLPVSGELAMIDVNCRSVVELTHGFSNSFITRGRGGIILFASLVGRQGTPHAATYAATKAFIQSFGEAIHQELHARGVDVLVAAPGPVNSGFGKTAGMRMGMADEATPVARDILSALGRKQMVTPGTKGKMLTALLAPLPRRFRIAIIGQIMKGMSTGRQI